MTLNEERALVIGGSSGMGLAAARRLAEAGARVTIAGRSEDRLKRAAEGLPVAVETLRLDMGDRAGLEAAFSALGTLHHLVLAGSGSVAWGAFADVSADALETALSHKLVGYWRTIRAALPTLDQAGSVTLFSGAAARKAMPGTAALAAVNGGLNQMARTLAVELAPIRVNTISPGLVDTPAYDGMPEDARRGMLEGAAKAVPIGRLGTADEVAEAVCFLVSNRYVTGALLDVDGGTRL